jgi:hypothetical protein
MMVPQVGLEPTRLSALASKTSVATITPPGQLNLFMNLLKTFHHVIGTIHPCNKLERDSVRHLGFIQTILQLYSDLPIGRGSNPLPSTVSVLRRNLDSVIFSC